MTYRFAACTMPQCQTSAGCICERALRPTRPADPLSGATPVELAVAKLELRAGDVLVARFDQTLDEAVRGRIRDHLTSILPQGVKCMVIDLGIDLTVIRRERAPAESGRVGTAADIGCFEYTCQAGRGDPPMDCIYPDCPCGDLVIKPEYLESAPADLRGADLVGEIRRRHPTSTDVED